MLMGLKLLRNCFLGWDRAVQDQLELKQVSFPPQFRLIFRLNLASLPPHWHRYT
jgi:hypothetical protein